MFRLTVDKYSCCLEQSYLLDLLDMVTPQVFVRKDKERMCMCMYTHRFVYRLEECLCS